MVWGVLDGHGHDNGGLASQVGARVMKAWFEENHEALTKDPQASMRLAFEQASRPPTRARYPSTLHRKPPLRLLPAPSRGCLLI